MNPINFFKFLEKEKGKPIPFLIKHKNGLPLTPKELDIKDFNTEYHSYEITSLPNNLKVRKDLIIPESSIISLPKGLQVGRDLDVSGTEITSLPSDLKVGRDIYLYDTPLSEKSEKEIRAMLKSGYIEKIIFK
jgi:hypothetical protein